MADTLSDEERRILEILDAHAETLLSSMPHPDDIRKMLDEFQLVLRAARIEGAKSMREVRKLVEKQAEDEGLWFIAETAPEGYLQQELRKLHAAIERALPDES